LNFLQLTAEKIAIALYLLSAKLAAMARDNFNGRCAATGSVRCRRGRNPGLSPMARDLTRMLIPGPPGAIDTTLATLLFRKPPPRRLRAGSERENPTLGWLWKIWGWRPRFRRRCEL